MILNNARGFDRCDLKKEDGNLRRQKASNSNSYEVKYNRKGDRKWGKAEMVMYQREIQEYCVQQDKLQPSFAGLTACLSLE